MDINRKLELAEQHIRSISRHDEADTTVRGAVLDRLIATIQTEQTEMKARAKAAAAAAMEPPTAPPAPEPSPAAKAKR